MSRQVVCALVALVLGGASWCAADDKKDAAKGELQQLEGRWAVVSMEGNGRKMLPKDLSPQAPLPMIVFKEGKGTYVVVKPGGQGKAREMPVVIDATQTPKTLDVQMTMQTPGGPKTFSMLKGIYQLDGDTLKICYNNPMAAGGVPVGDLPRPKELKTDAKNVILTLTRQKQ